MSASTQHTVLKHHFDNLDQQHASERLGMWMFLATEVLFFAGVFGAYTMYRMWYSAEFQFASSHLLLWVAALNTAFLITSSLTMTLAIRSARLGDKKGLYRNLLITFALGAAFMGMKAYEYATDAHEKYVPGTMFRGEYARAVDAVAKMSTTEAEAYFKANEGKHEHWASDMALKNHGKQPGDAGFVDPGKVQLFLCFYYIMTGIHGIHIIVGLGCILWLVLETYRGTIPPANYSTVECVSLYWHLVDAIWLFLMPLLYLADSGVKTMADTPHAPETTHDYAKDADKPGLLVVVWLAVIGLAAANVLIAMSGFGSHTYIRLPMTEMGMSVALITQLAIASVQAVLVAYHFMHLKQGDKVVTLTALASIFWTAILFALFLIDFASRKWVVG